jgi:hypothetical protein
MYSATTNQHLHLPYRYDQFVFRRVRFTGRRPLKKKSCHTFLPDLGGFGDSLARISFHPAARNETLFEAESLQAGLQGHCWVKQAHGDGSCSHADSCHANSFRAPQCCRRAATRRPPMPQPRATFILLATTQHPWPAARPATTDHGNHGSRHGLEEVQKLELACSASLARGPRGPRRTRLPIPLAAPLAP